MRDRIVAIDAERNEHIGGRVRDAALHEPDAFAGDIAGSPRDRDAPHDVGEHVQQADAQIWDCMYVFLNRYNNTPTISVLYFWAVIVPARRTCDGKLLDEEIHA